MNGTDNPRRFYLQRDTDETGVSGTGRVCNGVLWPDGTVSIRWCARSDFNSFTNWEHGMTAVEEIHGHGGATRIMWID